MQSGMEVIPNCHFDTYTSKNNSLDIARYYPVIDLEWLIAFIKVNDTIEKLYVENWILHAKFMVHV